MVTPPTTQNWVVPQTSLIWPAPRAR
jgi:hypothetical protein